MVYVNMPLKIDFISKIINSTMQCSGERVSGVINYDYTVKLV
jgi:hypothetical protein